MATTGGLLAAQQMMTLAALAGTAETEPASGESLVDRQLRVQRGINAQLAMTSLATAGDWQAVWVGLTASRDNLACIARNLTVPHEYAVVLRGATFTSLEGLAEELDVGTLVPFPQGGVPLPPARPGSIARGAMLAFSETTSAVYRPGGGDGLAGTTLLEALTALIQGSDRTPTISVTGHGLGGATATTVALWLDALPLRPAPVIHVYTFAAPTAGDADFASWFDQVFPPSAASGSASFCVWNEYDVVPNAWADLPSILSFYPPPPGPTAPDVVKEVIDGLIWLTADSYVPPAQQPALNDPPTLYCPYEGVQDPVDQWAMQAAFQHRSSTYLQLLGAPQLPDPMPAVLPPA